MESESQNSEFLSTLRAEKDNYTTTGCLTKTLVRKIENPFIKPTFYIEFTPAHRNGTLYCRLSGIPELIQFITDSSDTADSISDILHTEVSFTINDESIYIDGTEYRLANELPAETVNLRTELTHNDKSKLRNKIRKNRIDGTTGVLSVDSVTPSAIDLTLLTTQRDLSTVVNLPKSYDSSHESVSMIDTLAGGTIEILDGMAVQISTTESDSEDEFCLHTDVGEIYISDCYATTDADESMKLGLSTRLIQYFK